MSKLTQGTHLYFLNTSGETPEVVKVDCATSLNPGSDPIGEIDDTCLESNEMEYLAGMRNPGSATVGLRPDGDYDSHITMWNLSRMDPSPKMDWAVGWSDGTVKPRFGQGVESVAVSEGGTGYDQATTTVTFSDPEDSAGKTATGTVTVVNGAVTDITVTDPGSGYTAAPDVTITDSGAGTGATATATLGDYGFVLPNTRTWFVYHGYISDFPFDFQTNSTVAGDMSIRRSGGAKWIKKGAV